MVASILGVLAPRADAQGSPVFVFHGGGWGHGVGMSQNGARHMANQGFDHVGILAHYYPNTVVLPTAPLGDIRVHIGDASLVEMSSEGSITFERNGTVLNAIGSGTIQVSAHDGGLQIGSAWTTGSAADPVFVSFPQPVKISNNGHRYLWGKFQLTNRGGKVRVVEVLPFERYVAGISEMPAAWPLEALMAQAIAARTYAHEVTLHRRASSEWAQEYDISGSTVDQNYIGWDAQDGPWDAKWTAAVSATAGVEIVDANGPVRAYYSASNGGWTETAAYVFNNDVAHTVAGPDPYDAGDHGWNEWTRTYTQSAMSRWLNAYSDTSVGTLTAINVLGGEGASGRLDRATVELVGTGGTKRVNGKRLMIVMNAGIFGEGLGLDDHLPGTYTTIGNGASAGFPQASGESIPATVTPDPVESDVPADEDVISPPGWQPEIGSGVAPLVLDPGSASDDGNSDDDAPQSFAPPPDDGPQLGTGSPPVAAGADGATGPVPGTGVAPIQIQADGSADGPVPGTGVAPVPAGSSGSDTAGGTGGGDANAPLLGTGVAPTTSSTGLASTVVLVTRVDGGSPGEAQFRVVDEYSALADDDRLRLQQLQTQAAVALFADFDIEGYVREVAPRPVHAVCTATEDGITCVSLRALLEVRLPSDGADEAG